MADSKKVQVFSSGGVMTARAPGDTPVPLVGGIVPPTVYTLAAGATQIPSAVTSGVGARAFVSDANATIIAGLGLTAAAGGANKVPVYSDGANWLIG